MDVLKENGSSRDMLIKIQVNGFFDNKHPDPKIYME